MSLGLSMVSAVRASASRVSQGPYRGAALMGCVNVQAQRTKDTVPLVQEAERAVLLSGTPALARPRELLPQLQALLPAAKLKLADYGSRYCAAASNRFNPAWGKYEGAHPSPQELVWRQQRC